eukprot:scaffold190065_cov28-Tisochrysis_lutea.AAC.1
MRRADEARSKCAHTSTSARINVPSPAYVTMRKAAVRPSFGRRAAYRRGRAGGWAGSQSSMVKPKCCEQAHCSPRATGGH